jgi:hypothetical protein
MLFAPQQDHHAFSTAKWNPYTLEEIIELERRAAALNSFLRIRAVETFHPAFPGLSSDENEFFHSEKTRLRLIMGPLAAYDYDWRIK